MNLVGEKRIVINSSFDPKFQCLLDQKEHKVLHAALSALELYSEGLDHEPRVYIVSWNEEGWIKEFLQTTSHQINMDPKIGD